MKFKMKDEEEKVVSGALVVLDEQPFDENSLLAGFMADVGAGVKKPVRASKPAPAPAAADHDFEESVSGR